MANPAPPHPPALPQGALPWPPEITNFLQNIGDGSGYFNPRALGHRSQSTAVQVTRQNADGTECTNREMVLKVINLTDKSDEWRSKFSGNQIEALRKFKHDHLIICHKAFAELHGTLWFAEYDLFHCDLAAAIKNHEGKRLPEDKGKKWCRQILSAIMFLHENHWPHRDLKLENVLVTQVDDVVVTDFTFTHEQKTGLPNPMAGSLIYASPELLADPTHANPYKADIWALGVLFYCMHSDTKLFREETDVGVIQAEHNLLTYRIHEVAFTFFLKSLLINLLNKDPQQRLELKDALQHPWFTGKTGGLDAIRFDAGLLGGKGYLNPKEIGSGSFATVYDCVTREHPNVHVAVKYINLSTVNDVFLNKMFIRERKALLRLHHKYIVPVLDVFSDKKEIQWFIVMQLCPSNLRTEVKKFAHRKVPESTGRIWSNQIVQALKYLHDYLWVHRDLKIENVLMNGQRDALLGDFTFARQQVKGSLSETRCGSMRYMAPEVSKRGKYDGFRSDIWSMGCVVFAIHAGEPPIKEKRILAKIWKEQADVASEIKRQAFSPSLTDLLTNILKFDAKDRLPLEQVLSHVWFTEGPLHLTHAAPAAETHSLHKTRSDSAPVHSTAGSSSSSSHPFTSPTKESSSKRKRSGTDAATPSHSKKILAVFYITSCTRLV